jgi:hypothetical protein
MRRIVLHTDQRRRAWPVEARRAAVGLGAALLLTTTSFGPAVHAAKDADPPVSHVVLEKWSDATDFDSGSHDGTTTIADDLALEHAHESIDYTDPHATPPTTTTYDRATWTSPVTDPDFPVTELVASWNADAPSGSWIEVAVSGVTEGDVSVGPKVLGRWSESDEGFHSTSVPAQGDDHATVAIDTLVMREGQFLDTYQLHVSLMRSEGGASPTVSLVSAMASAAAEQKKRVVSDRYLSTAEVLDVPTYSQETHIGHFPEFDNGGEAWCSPTSTAMVLDFFGAGPGAAETAWVRETQPDEPDPQVDHAARYTYDYNYDGAGNWPFNTAYAGSRATAAGTAVEGFVTRLRSLNEAERFIAAGIPVVTSLSFKKSKLDGAGYGTNGHLMVIVGFDAEGDVVVNDPASHLMASNEEVRTTYDRSQFETAWIDHTGGIGYVIHPEDVPLPPAPPEANW